MQAYRLNLKLYLVGHSSRPNQQPLHQQGELDQERLIPIFHRWIQDQALSDDVLIDVADYKHVPDGPGVMLIAHQANYGLDASDGHLGLLFAQKRPDNLTLDQRLEAAFERTLHVAQLLEKEIPELRFASDHWAVRIQDRLLAPHTADTFQAVEPPLRSLLRAIYPEADTQLDLEEDTGAGFGIRVKTSATPGLALLRQRLETISLPLAAVA